ncbi:MAG: AAA-like domain-containing protein [Fimbriimonadaceae bacterium]
MPEAAAPNSSFFVAGGTMRWDAPSYVERSADRELLSALMAGQFCYVLDSRQMGKSSLMSRAISRLEAEGVACAKLDLQRFGANLDVERWYAGLLNALGDDLGCTKELFAYWASSQMFGPLERWMGAIEHVVLPRLGDGRLCVFVDEIDFVRSLPFSTDEFFAGIRELYNRRSSDPKFSKIAFCLLGVATPGDLISQTRITPFNIGERIYLKDFTLEEAMPLASGLGDQRPQAGQWVNGSTGQLAGSEKPEATKQKPETNNQQLLARVFHWTNGHPYLTQSLCMAVAADASVTTPSGVDALVKRDLFEPKARETNINLADVANRALHAGDSEADPEKFRADLLSGYEKALKGKPLADDESNRVAALLKLSGIMRSQGNQLKVRNRIYERVFDKAWVRENMPGQELRRRKRAFWLGVVRTAVVAAIVVTAVSILAVRDRQLAISNESLAKHNADMATQARKAQLAAEYQAYVADLSAMREADSEKSYDQLAKLIEETRSSPFRGMEWGYWNALIHDDLSETSVPTDVRGSVIAEDGKSILLVDATTNGAVIYTYPELNKLADVRPVAGSWFTRMFGHWATLALGPRSVELTDALSRKALATVSCPAGVLLNFPVVAPDRRALALLSGAGTSSVANTISMWLGSPVHLAHSYRTNVGIDNAAISGGGRLATLALHSGSLASFFSTNSLETFRVVDLSDGRQVDEFAVDGIGASSIAMSNDGRYAAVGRDRGRAVVRDVKLHKDILDLTRVDTAAVDYMSFSQDDRRLLLQCGESVQAYDLATRRLICAQRGGSRASLAPDGRTLAGCGRWMSRLRREEYAGGFATPLRRRLQSAGGGPVRPADRPIPQRSSACRSRFPKADIGDRGNCGLRVGWRGRQRALAMHP